MDEQLAFQDFLELTLSDFRLRYKSEFSTNKELNQFIRKLKNDPPLLDREVGKGNISHIRKYKASRDKEIFIRDLEHTMRNKGISENGISSYIISLKHATKGKGDSGIGHFQYKGNPLTTIVFDKGELDINQLNHATNVNTQVLVDVVDALEKERPRNANIKLLRDYIKSLEKPLFETIEGRTVSEDINYFPDLALGSFNLELTARRKEIYKYWEKVSKEYQKVLNASKAIITEYKDNLKEYEEFDEIMKESNRNGFYYTFKELVENVDDPKTHQNYVVTLEPQEIIVTDLNEGRIHEVIRIWFNQLEKLQLSLSDGGVDYSKKDGHAEQHGWLDDEGMTPEQIQQYEQLEEDLRRHTQQEKRQLKTMMKTKIVVDPLLLYLINNRKIELGAYSSEEAPKIQIGFKRAMRKIKYLLEELDDDSIVDDLEKYVDQIKHRASDAKAGDKFYLPNTSQVHREFLTDSMLRKNVISNHKKFLRAVNSLIQPEHEGDRTMHPVEQTFQRRGQKLPAKKDQKKGQDKTGKSPYPEPVGFTPGQKGMLREHSGKMKRLIKQLIKAIDKYYIDPANSQYYPFHRNEQDELFSDFEVSQLKLTLEVHWKKPKKQGWKAASVMAQKWNRDGIKIVSVSQMEDIIKWVSALKEYNGNNINQLIIAANNAYDALEDISTLRGTGRTLTEENKIYFAYLIDLMARKNGNDITDMKFPKYGGKLISELASEFDDNNEEYPMKALNKLIETKGEQFTAADMENTAHGSKKRKLMLEYLGMTKVTKSDIELDILYAHDTIRKIAGRPTYFAFGDVSDFNDINNTIDIINKSYSVELMPIEIENIVNDFNSHKDLSKKYGVSEEIIYRVKAMYR
jgi:Mor family transcriptional regulator